MNYLRHIGIIMDGNGRWAQRLGRPRIFGHIKGARIAKRIISDCAKRKIEFLTLYAFSTENWARPQAEVSFLMRLLKKYLQKEVRSLVAQNIRFTSVGQLSRLPVDVLEVIQETTAATQNCTGMNLVFALSYGSKFEITEAAKAIGHKIMQGDLLIQDVDETLFAKFLSTFPFPDVDLIVRTSGEKRLSNFLLWQSAYAELYFSDTLWPDFNESEFDFIIADFNKRQRKYGATAASVTSLKVDAELSY